MIHDAGYMMLDSASIFNIISSEQQGIAIQRNISIQINKLVA